jgi:uncharacterized protein YbjT (DUF2867 family)
MRIVVVGGTGLVGRPTVAELLRRGHSVAVLSRRGEPGQPGAEAFAGDLTTGEGVAPALAGADCIVNCCNPAKAIRKQARTFFQVSTERLGEYAAAAGVAHHIVLSIVGIDRVSTGYYAGKLAQERALLNGPVPATVQRATQFHEYARYLIKQTSFGPLFLVPAMRLQPIATSAVAAQLADAAEAGPVGRAPDVGGPRPEHLAELARALLRARRRRALVVPVPVPGSNGRAMRDGALLIGPTGVARGPSFVDWLGT